MNTVVNEAQEAFNEELLPGALHVGPMLQQRIDLIEHLLEFGRQLIALTGPNGSGKSTLLRAIAQAAAARWHCVLLQGGPALSAHALLSQVATELDTPQTLVTSQDDAALLAGLRQRMGVIEHGGRLVVLVVDDADKLPAETLAMLVAMARTDNALAEARVLMTADSSHDGLLAALQGEHPQHGLVHVVEIPPLSEEQVAAFLAQRLSAVGAQLETWFQAADIAEITEGAGGIPGQIVALARQALHGRAPYTAVGRSSPGLLRDWRLPAKWPAFNPRQLVRWSPALVLVLIIGFWLTRSGPAPAPPTVTVNAPVGLSTAVTPPVAEGSAARTPVPESPPTPALVPLTRDAQQRLEITLPPASNTSATLAPIVAPTATAPVPDTTTPATPTATGQPIADAARAVDPPASSPSLQPTPVLPPPAKKKIPPRPAVTAKPPAKPIKPIASSAKPALAPPAVGLPASAVYTLQLFGVSERAAATRFIASQQLAAQARVINTQREGRAWFIVVYGGYPTRAAAEKGAANLPAAVRRASQPWIRTTASLKSLPR
jgi:DamX protein